MEQHKAHILVADDEPGVRTMVREMLEQEGWRVDTAPDGRVALECLEREAYTLAILDLKMPGLTGTEVLFEIQKREIRTDVLILTGYGTIQTAVQAIKMGAKDFLCKPFARNDLIRSVQLILAQHAPVFSDFSERLEAFLEASAFDPDLGLEDMARQFGISSRQVTNVLKARTGMPFKKRLTFYRIEEAKRLLRSGQAPLYEIAKQCGFRDYRQLTAAFQKVEGVSPKEFRRIGPRETDSEI
ncbi:MAG: DNA-binding response regulator [bacterium]|nr:DNA-binding response regulator [bacterium]